MPRPPRAVLVILLVVFALAIPTAGAGASSPPGKRTPQSAARAVWVWDRPDPAVLVRFVTGNDVTDVFVSTPGGLATHPDLAWFQELRARTASAGVRLHALGAETDWIDDPAGALAWQRQAVGSGLFDGVHLDVEPWLHPGWGTDREGVAGAYLDLLAALSADTSLPVEADIAFWLDQVLVRGERLDEAVMARVDAVTVMSYRDTVTGVDSITAVAASSLDAARRSGTPIRLAVETNYLGDDPVSLKQTFHGSSRRQLASAMRAVDRVVGGHPGYRGIAVHDLAGWRAMPAR